jgi:hypothetical protein
MLLRGSGTFTAGVHIGYWKQLVANTTAIPEMTPTSTTVFTSVG